MVNNLFPLELEVFTFLWCDSTLDAVVAPKLLVIRSPYCSCGECEALEADEEGGMSSRFTSGAKASRKRKARFATERKA